MLNLHQETYQINGGPCRVVANFRDDIINIFAHGYSEQFTMDEYTNFEGNMQEFATSKLEENEL